MSSTPTRIVTAALTVLALGLGCASQHEIIEFTPIGDHELEAREAAAPSERSAEELREAGYEQIGVISITRVVSVCFETCERVDHEQDTATELLHEAGKRGGEVVILDRLNEEFTREVRKRGECLESYSHHQHSPLFVPVYAGDGGAVAREPRPTPNRPAKICTHFETLHGHEVFVESSGSVWARR